jgi:hypothetical protein
LKGVRTGFFLNDRFRLSPKLYVTAGGRVSRLDAGNSRTAFDPRKSLAFLASKSDTLRLSAGLYHQFGDWTIRMQEPGLRPASAAHVSASFDRIQPDRELRATIYDKEYRGLFLDAASGGSTNDGSGFARGAELFLKSKGSAWDFIAVYNFLSSRRKEGGVAVSAPSPFEIRHAGTLIATRKFKSGSISARVSAASGRPYTPLLGRDWDETASAYDPVWGSPMSARYPWFSRIDVSGSRMLTLGKTAAVLIFGVTNILDTVNVSGYEYGADYAERKDQRSIFGRTVFLGFLVLL